MPCYNGHKISGSQPYLLDRDGHFGEQTMEEKFGVLPFCSWVESRTGKSYMSIFFLPHLQDHGLLRCGNFATKGQGLYLSVTFFVELTIGRGSYIPCMKRLRKGENICVLFENPTHCSIGTAGRRNKCREDHGSYRCSSQSRNCVFNCNDLLCI